MNLIIVINLFIYCEKLHAVEECKKNLNLCNICNIAMRDLPDMYALSPWAGLQAYHIRKIMNGHITSIMYHFVPKVTTPVV